MKKLALLLTIALAATACTIYFGPGPGDDDGDHPDWQVDAQPIPSDAAAPYYPDAAPVFDHDAGCNGP